MQMWNARFTTVPFKALSYQESTVYQFLNSDFFKLWFFTKKDLRISTAENIRIKHVKTWKRVSIQGYGCESDIANFAWRVI